MTTRKRANWPKKLAAARVELKPLRPAKGEPARWATRDRDGTWRDDAGNALPADTGAKFENHVVANAGAVVGAAKRAGRLASEDSQETYRRRAAVVAAFVGIERAHQLQKPLSEPTIRETYEMLASRPATHMSLASFDGFFKFLKREPTTVRAMIEKAANKK